MNLAKSTLKGAARRDLSVGVIRGAPVLMLALICGICGCGAGGDSASGAGFLRNRTTFLSLLALRGASKEEALTTVDDILEEATASATSNGLDENVVRFAELARAVIGIRMARMARMTDSTDAPEGGEGLLPDRWRIYRQYFEVARALAGIYAPELAAQFDKLILGLEAAGPLLDGASLVPDAGAVLDEPE